MFEFTLEKIIAAIVIVIIAIMGRKLTPEYKKLDHWLVITSLILFLGLFALIWYIGAK